MYFWDNSKWSLLFQKHCMAGERKYSESEQQYQIYADHECAKLLKRKFLTLRYESRDPWIMYSKMIAFGCSGGWGGENTFNPIKPGLFWSV